MRSQELDRVMREILNDASENVGWQKRRLEGWATAIDTFNNEELGTPNLFVRNGVVYLREGAHFEETAALRKRCERLESRLALRDTCAHCQCSLEPVNETPPHCLDCFITEEDEERYDAAVAALDGEKGGEE